MQIGVFFARLSGGGYRLPAFLPETFHQRGLCHAQVGVVGTVDVVAARGALRLVRKAQGDDGGGDAVGVAGDARPAVAGHIGGEGDVQAELRAYAAQDAVA